MLNFDRISVNQLLVISQILSEGSLLRKEFVELKFSRHAINFLETIEFLDELDMIKIQQEDILLGPKYKVLLRKLSKSKQPDELVKSFIVNCLLTSKLSFSDYINSFLSEFQLNNGKYEFIPSASQRLEYSGIRNFFADLTLISIDISNAKYTISDDYLLLVTDVKKPKHLTPNNMLTIQNRKAQIGNAAEIAIVEYEKERLSLLSQYIYLIEHVASKDVMAGYDIKSFEDHLDRDGNPITRFIEVKAVSPWNYKFYWSRNEIEKAILYSTNYYLYLLPVIGVNQFDLENLKIVANPYINIYQNTSEWNKIEELVVFSM